MFDIGVPGGAGEALACAEAAVADLRGVDTSAWSNLERVGYLRRKERLVRSLQGLDHTVINQLAEQGAPVEFGGVKLRELLAQELSVSLSEAGERVRTAADLGPTTLVTGEVLGPRMPELAQAQAGGLVGVEHVRVVRGFDQHVPAKVPAEAKQEACASLAGFATRLRPDQLHPLSVRLLACLDPDGSLEDERDRRRKSYITLGVQGADKMTRLTGLIGPEARAYIEVVFAKLAAPGVLNPDAPVSDNPGATPEEAAQRDGRSLGQRQHDAITFLARRFADGKTSVEDVRAALHRGVPMVVNATVTLRELYEAAGLAYTTGQTAIPYRDLIRMASKAICYLTIFDDHHERVLHLGKAKRVANLDQRIALTALETGCTAPGCTSPPNYCEAHHVKEWSSGGRTDIDNLTLACPAHHKLIGQSPRHWKTTKPPDGGPTTWHPPAYMQHLHRWLTDTNQAACEVAPGWWTRGQAAFAV